MFRGAHDIQPQTHLGSDELQIIWQIKSLGKLMESDVASCGCFLLGCIDKSMVRGASARK